MIVALMFLMFFYTIGLAINFSQLPDAKGHDPVSFGTLGLVLSFICHIAVLGMLLTTIYAAPNLNYPSLIAPPTTTAVEKPQ
jgi:hypothetical protein